MKSHRSKRRKLETIENKESTESKYQEQKQTKSQSQVSKVSEVSENWQDWKLFLSFPLHDVVSHGSADSQLKYHGRLFVHRGNGGICHHGKRYAVSLTFANHHWNLLAIAKSLHCPFLVYCVFAIDRNMAQVFSYELWISEKMFLQCMTVCGTFQQEIDITRLIRSSMSTCTGHNEAQYLLDRKNDQRKTGLRDLPAPVIPLWNSEFPLLGYQVESFRWMLELEQRIRQGKAMIKANTTSMPIGHTGWHYHRIQDTLAPVCDENAAIEVPYHGGILADCTGSGKTAIILAVIAATLGQRIAYSSIPPIDRDVFFTSTATLIVLPSNLPHQWIGEMAKFYGSEYKKQIQVISVLNQPDHDKLTLTEIQNADIILTTFNFFKSKGYHDSVVKHITDTLGDPNGINGISGISSISSSSGDNSSGSSSSTSYDLTQPYVIRMVTRAALHRTPPGFASDRCPPFQSIWWKRIVIDEAHELFLTPGTTNRRKAKVLPLLHSSCIWGITGTPDVGTGGMLSDFCNLIACDPPQWTPEFYRQVVDSCFHRYNSLEFGPIEEHVHWIQLTDLEKRLLETHAEDGTETAVKLCTYFDLAPSSCSAPNGGIRLRELKEIITLVKKRREERINELQRIIRQQKNTLNSVKSRLEVEIIRKERLENMILTMVSEASETPEASEASGVSETKVDTEETKISTVDERKEVMQADLDLLEDRMQNDQRRKEKFERNIQKSQQELNQIIQSLEYFHRQVSDYGSVTCPVCLDSSGNILTSCGHQFCRVCITTILKQTAENEDEDTETRSHSAVCPICKTEITDRDVHEVKEPVSEGSRSDIIRRYGSKITNLLDCLHEIVNRGEKTLIFVQWLPLMKSLKTILEEQGIHTGCVANNIRTQNAAIQKFTRGETDVLLLMLEAMSSGLNLVNANHIIFLHALVGNDSTVRMMEEQAIHRSHRTNQQKHVHIHWFIAERTQEERIFKTRRRRIKRRCHLDAAMSFKDCGCLSEDCIGNCKDIEQSVSSDSDFSTDSNASQDQDPDYEMSGQSDIDISDSEEDSDDSDNSQGSRGSHRFHETTEHPQNTENESSDASDDD